MDFDRVYATLIRSAAEAADFDPLRSDEIAEPGRITDQFLRELFHADTVLADVTLPNENVFYELGVRQTMGTGPTILIARTEEDPDIPQAGNSAFLVDLPSEGWEIVRDVETMSGAHNHCEIRIENLRLPNDALLGGRGQGHLLGQARLGPARLAHCMRWIGQAETALEMMVERSLKRFAHGSLLAEKQGIQWMIADSTMELYQGKLMVLHAAYRIDRGEDFRSEVSMAKHFVANALNRIVDRAIQVHGALGYSPAQVADLRRRGVV